MKVKMRKSWVVNGRTFMSKSAAYRYCRTLNGKKHGGRRPYNVQREAE